MLNTLYRYQARKADDESELGFTLIELLIVIVVLGILAAVTVFALGGVTSQSAVSACNADAKTVDVAVAAYNVETGYNPTHTHFGGADSAVSADQLAADQAAVEQDIVQYRQDSQQGADTSGDQNQLSSDEQVLQQDVTAAGSNGTGPQYKTAVELVQAGENPKGNEPSFDKPTGRFAQPTANNLVPTYLQSFPHSSHYTILLHDGVVFVNAGAGFKPQPYDNTFPNPCSRAK